MSVNICQVSKCLKGPVKGLLLDITGVLYESGTTKAIDGSIEAINRLRNLGVPFRFVTNETQRTRKSLVQKLQSFGFMLKEAEIFAPAPAVAKIVKEKQLRPLLLMHPDVKPEFEGCDLSSPNCVVVGDAAEYFTYENVNKAFQLLISLKDPILISMGKGFKKLLLATCRKYYKEKDDLVLDLGAYATALEFAVGIEAIVIGKPAPEFFLSALNDIGVKPEEAIMIGDDINSDVGAAQKCGLRGVLVRTGKFRTTDEEHKFVTPDVIVDNLKQFVEMLSALQ